MRFRSFGVVPEDNKTHNRVIKALKERFKNEPILLYYKPLIHLNNKNYVPDVVLLHPKVGITLIKIKEWNADFLKRVIWASDGSMIVNGHRFKNPIDEMGELVSTLALTFRYRYPINTFVYFPNITKGEFGQLYNVQGKLRDVLLKWDTEVKEKILKAGGKEQFEDLPEEEFQELRATLFPYLKLNDEEVLDLSQEDIIHNFQRGIRILRGLAGTGKTAVLAAKTKYELLKNRKLIFFTYTKSLLQEFKIRVGEEINAYTIHDYLSKEHESYKIYNIDSVVEQIHPAEQFDFVIGDEVQDFPAPFFKLLHRLLKPDGKILLGVDETQRVYKWCDWTWKDVGIDAQGKVTIFKKIYRNPSMIMRFGLEFLKMDKTLIKTLKELTAVDMFEENAPIAIRKGGNIICISETVLKRFLDIYKPKETFILVPSPKDVEYYREIFKKKGVKIIYFTQEIDLEQIPEGTYLIATFVSSKGMERKNVVILLNQSRIVINSKKDEHLWRRIIYVAITRAKENIIILGEGKFFNELVEIKHKLDEERQLLKEEI